MGGYQVNRFSNWAVLSCHRTFQLKVRFSCWYLLLRFWNRTGKIPVLILNEISMPAQHWQQTKRWAGYLINQINTGFGFFLLKLRNETTAFGYLEKPESKSYHKFRLLQNPQRTARFHERTGGVLGWLFDLFETLGTAVIHRNRVFVFWGLRTGVANTQNRPDTRRGALGAVSCVRPTLGTTIVYTTSKQGAQVRGRLGRQGGEMEFFLVDDGCMRCMWVQEIQDATRVERRIQRSWRRP